MANTPSAKKAVRKIDRRTAVNRSRRSKMRTPIMMRAAQNGIVHKNAASRKVSRLTKRVRALAQ
jgi:small subunit ribosomal protein S20